MGEEGNGTELGEAVGTSARGITDRGLEVFVRATFALVTETVGALFFRTGSLKLTLGKRGVLVLANKGVRAGRVGVGA